MIVVVEPAVIELGGFQYLWLTLFSAIDPLYITKTRPCKILQFLTAVKTIFFRLKIVMVFLIFAQNIDCGYTLEPPQ